MTMGLLRTKLPSFGRVTLVWRQLLTLLCVLCPPIFLTWLAVSAPLAVASAQGPHAPIVAKNSAADLPGVARFIRDEKGMSLVEFSGDYDIEFTSPRQTVAKEFFRTHADVYDFLVIFTSFDFPMATSDPHHPRAKTLAVYHRVRNDTKGIGIPLSDGSSAFGSQGVLQGYIDMSSVKGWSSATSSADYDQLLATFAHEVQHRWGSFVKFRDWNGKVSSALLGSGGAHWSSLLDTQASVMYGANWRDNGDGTFTAVETRSTYSSLDLYLAGLIDKSKVAPITLIESTDIDPKDLPPPKGTTIRGTKRTVTIDDIIAVEGPRVPSAAESQKSFRFGFIYLVRPGETIDPSMLDVAAQARRQVGLRFNALTQGMGTANVFAEPASTLSPGTPTTILPAGPPATMPGQNSAGLAWLKSQQKSDGSLMDAAGLAPRDTLLARSYLRAVDPSYSGLGAATAWIAGQQFRNTDFLARKITESTAGERKAEDVAALMGLRNADGGWGLGDNLLSNPLDTAWALQALRQVNAEPAVLKNAADLLLGWQNSDGGWGNVPGGASRVIVTSQALRALARDAFSEGSLTKAKAFLKSKQNADGGFGDSASSIHDTAHVILAMGNAGFNAEVNQAAAQRFVADSQRMDGSWQGSVYSTVLALQLMRSNAAANLAVSGLQALPQPIYDGQRVTLSVKVVNVGALQSQPSTVRFFDGDPAAGGLAIGDAIPVPALVPGDAKSVQAVWNTTSRSGQRTVYAVADLEQATVELTRQDNITSLTVMVERPNASADVLIAEGDVLATPSSVSKLPASIKVDALVSNAGLAGVSNAKAVLWVGTGATRKRLEEATFSVAARATTGIQFTTTLNEAGSTVYTVELDPDGLLNEASRANNSASVTVKTVGGVSLAVKPSDITVNPKTPLPGSDAVFAVRLHNDGTQDSTSFNVRYSIRSGAGTSILQTNVVQLAAGAHVDQSIPWRAGSGGSYSFIVEVDPEKRSGDVDVSDNTATLAFTVAATAGVNLAVSYKDISFAPTPALEGENLVLSALVRNTGDVDSTGFDVEFYEGDPAAGGALIGTSRLAALPANGSATAAVNWVVPTASERLVFVALDKKRAQPSEVTLDDNVAFASLKVLSLPDFALSPGAISLAPRLPRPGEATQMTVTVANLGEQAASGVVVSVFSGNPTAGVKLVPDGVVPALAAKSSASVQFSFNAPASASLTDITVVVNPQFVIKERVRDNNQTTVTLGTQDGNFSVSESFISPNGDGIKDRTVLTYRLTAATAATAATALVLDEQGRILRNSGPLGSGTTGAWSWDGLDTDGRLVPDGKYELVVRNAQDVVLGGATVEVDTNRSPLLTAIGTSVGANAGLTCSAPQGTSVRSIRDGSGFYLDVRTALDPAVDLPAGIYRQDDWGRGLRMVLAGPLDNNTGQSRQWSSHVFNHQGTRLVAYDQMQAQLLSSGGEGEGRRVIFTRPINGLVDLVKNGDEVLVQSEESKLLAIDTRTGAQRVLIGKYVYNVAVSPDKTRLIASTDSGVTLWVDVASGNSKELPNSGSYYWSPNGAFLVTRLDGRLLLLDSNGDHYGEIQAAKQNGREAWAEDSSELYLPTSSGCLVSQDGRHSECSITLYRIDVVSGQRTVVQSFTEKLDLKKFSPTGVGVDLAVVPGRYELLASLYVLSGEGRRSSGKSSVISKAGKAEIVGDFASTGSEYRVIDLRSPFAMKSILFDQVPPPNELDGNGSASVFIEYGRALQYRSSNSPAELPTCVAPEGQVYEHTYAFRTLSNMQTDLVLSRRADGVSVRIHGGVSDRNFSRYWLDYANEEAPDVWHPVVPASTTPAWGKDLATWLTPGPGRYMVRLTVEDLAGNRKEKVRRVAIAQAGPPITNILREPAIFSPNGDGSKDEMKLSYRVLESVNLEFGIFNRQGALVRSISRVHPVGGVDAVIFWDGRDSNGQTVVDGEYRINVAGFDFFVTVDNSAPVIHSLVGGAPLAKCDGGICRTTELRWAVRDANFDAIQIEVGEGATPSKWRPFQGLQRITDNLVGSEAVFLSLGNYAGHRYRLVAMDLAGNRSVGLFEPPQEMLRLLSVAQILQYDLQKGEPVPAPQPTDILNWKYAVNGTLDVRPSAGIALAFAESLNEPVVNVAVQFNELALAQKGEWLEQPNVQIYPVPDGYLVPYISEKLPKFRIDGSRERSALDEGSPVPQDYGMVRFFNGNIPVDNGVKVRLKLTGASGTQYLTNEVTVKDDNKLAIENALLSSSQLTGTVALKTSRIVRKLEVFVSSQGDPHFAIERKILATEPNSVMPEGSKVGFAIDGRFVSCTAYTVRAVATLENGQLLIGQAPMQVCGGVEFAARPEFEACGVRPQHKLRGIATPVNLGNVPLLSLEVYAQAPSANSRELIFNVVNPTYQPYEFIWDHSAFPAGTATLIGITTDRDGVKRTGEFAVQVDHTPVALRITYPQESQKVCAVPEWHKRDGGVADELVNALRPVAEIDDAAGFDYLLEFRRDDEDSGWQQVSSALPSIVSPDPRTGGRPLAAAQPYDVKEFKYLNNARSYMSGKRVAGELGPITNFSGAVSARVTAFDWSGARVCRQVNFYLDGTVDVGPAAVDRRLFSPGTSSSLTNVIVALTLMEPVSVTAAVRRVIVTDELQTVQEGAVRRLATKLALQRGGANLVWDGRDDAGNYVADGDYVFDITYEDGCGNLKVPSSDNKVDSVRQSLRVQVDRTPPALQLDRPLAGEVTSSFLDIIGSVKDKNLQQWTLEYALDGTPDNWSMLASQTKGVDQRKLANLNATQMVGVIALRLRAIDKVELKSELTRDLRIKPHTELIRKFVASPSPFSPNGDGRRDGLDVAYDVIQPVALDLTIKRGAVIVRRLLSQLSAVPGERGVAWDGRDDAMARAPDGEYTLELRATSTTDATHSQVEEISVLLDATPPLFTTDTAMRPFMAGNVALRGSIADAALSQYNIYVEGPLPSNRRVLLAEGSEVMIKQSLGTLEALGLDDARYRIRVRAGDEAENSSEYVSPEFELDSMPPVASFSSPAPGTFVSRVRPADIAGQVDDRNLLGVELKIANTIVATAPVAANPQSLVFTFDGMALPDGRYPIQLIGTDKAGNIGLANGTVNVDNTLPVAQITSPAANTPVGTMIPVIGTASDANMQAWKLELGSGVGEGVDSLTVIARGAGNVEGAELTKLVGLPPDGPATLRLTVLDKGGNVSTFDVPLQIDATPPAAPVLTGQREQRNDVRLGWAAPADASRIAGYNVYRNGSKINPAAMVEVGYLDKGLLDGNYAYAVTAVSRSGVESARSNVVTIGIKASGPFVEITKPASNAVVGGLVSIEGSAYAVTSFRSYEVAVSTESEPDKWTVLRASALQVRGDVLATWSTVGLPEDARYKIRLTADDIQGGVSTTTVTVSTDNVAPAMPAGLQAQLSGTNDVRLNWTPNAEQDLAGYLLYRDGQLANQIDPNDTSITPYLLSGTTYLDKSLADGSYVYTLVAVDKAGNMSGRSAPASALVETRAPQAVIVQPTHGASVDGVTYVLAESKDLDVASVRFEFKSASDAGWSTIVGASSKVPYSVNWNTQSLPEGTYQLRAVATDTSGKTDPAPAAISVVRKNLQRPTVPTNLIALVDGDDVTLNWTASSSSNVRGYHILRTNSRGEATRINAAPVSGTTFTDPDRADDRYMYQVLAVNVDGNESDPTSPVPAWVYTTKLRQPYTPVSLLSTPVRGSSVNAVDAVSMTVTPDTGSTHTQSLAPDSNGNFSADSMPLLKGANIISARQTDTAGNRSQAMQVRVARGDLPAAPASVQAAAAGTALQVTWTASTSSEVDGYLLQIDGKYDARPFGFSVASASSTAGSYASADRAIDAYEYTSWQPDAADKLPSIELQTARKELVSEFAITWSPYLPPPAYFMVEAWDGYVWVPLKEELQNGAPKLELVLDPPYYTDRVRVSLAQNQNTDLTGAVGDARGKSLQIVSGQSATVPVPDGTHTVSVRTLSSLGLLGPQASAAPGTSGDVTPPPPVVASVSANGASATVSWTESVAADLAGYDVLRDGKVIARVPASEARQYVDGPLANGSYIYTVRPVDLVGNLGQMSNGAVASVAVAVPGAPIQLVVDAPRSGGELRLSWKAPISGSAVASYAVYRTTMAGNAGALLGTTGRDTLTYSDVSVSNGVRYYYVVKARSADGGEGEPSNEASGVAENRTAPLVFYPTDDAHPISTDINSTAVRMFTEPAVQVVLSREGIQLGTAIALQTTQSSPVLGMAGNWAPSPVGDLLASVVNGTLSIEKAAPALDGRITPSVLQSVKPGVWSAVPTWSPDATLIALPTGFGPTKIVHVASGALEGSLYNVPVDSLVWHPDGKRWIATVNGREVTEIQVDTGLNRVITTALDWPSRLAISPDGSHIAFVDGSTVTTHSLSSGVTERMSSLQPDVDEPLVWAPDSQSLYFLGADPSTSKTRLYRLPVGQTTPIPVTAPAQQVDSFAVSPVGSLAFASGRQLHLLDGGEFPLALGEVVTDVYAMKWAQSGALLVEERIGVRAHLVAGTALFPPVALKPGQNLLTATATGASGVPGRPGTISVTYRTTPNALPDLTVAAADITLLPGVPQVGAASRITLVVNNAGQAAAPAAALRVLAIAPDGSRTDLLNTRTAAFSAGANQVFRVDTRFDTAGEWRLTVAVDGGDEILESQEDNNTAVLPVRVVAPSSARTVDITLAGNTVQVGATLTGSTVLFNGQADVGGQLQLTVEDNLGFVVATLPAVPQALLAYGQSRTVGFNWTVPAVYDAPYKVRAVWSNGSTVLGQATAPFQIKPRVQVRAQVSSDSSSYAVGATARIVAQIDPSGTSPTTALAQVGIRVLNAGGAAVLESTDTVGLVAATQLVKLVNTAGWALGAYTVETKVLVEGLQAAFARTSFDILAATNPVAALDGDIVLDRTSASHTGVIAGTAILTNTGTADIGSFQYEVAVVNPRTNAVLARAMNDVAVLARGSETRSTFSFPALGMPIGTLWIQLRTTLPTLRSALKNGPPQNLLRQREIALFELDPPVVTFQQPVNGAYLRSAQSVRVAASDLLSGVRSVEFRVDAGPWLGMTLSDPVSSSYSSALPALTDGAHQVQARATDNSGNVSQPVQSSFVVDSAPPDIAISGVADSVAYTGTVTPVIDVTDLNPSVTQVQLNGAPFASGTAVTQPGAYVLQVDAIDRAGNVASRTVRFTVASNTPDTTPPVIDVKTPQADAYVRGAATPLSATIVDAESFVTAAEFSIDGGPFAPMAVDNSTGVSNLYTASLDSLTEGVHSVVVRARDTLVNEAVTMPRRFTVDNTPPVIGISGVSAGQYNSPVTPVISVSDAALAGSTATLNGAAYASGTAVSVNGDYLLSVSAVDAAGNSASASIQFSIRAPAADTTPPVVFVEQPSEAAHVRSGAALAVASTDTGSGVAVVEYRLDSQPSWGGMSLSATTGKHTADIGGLSDGPHVAFVRSTDQAGNTSAVQERRFVVDNTAPSIVVTGVANNGQYPASASASITVSDAHLSTSSSALNGSPYVSGSAISAPGAYTLVVAARDTAGNETIVSIQFRVTAGNVQQPAVSIVAPAADTVVRSGSLMRASVQPFDSIGSLELSTGAGAGASYTSMQARGGGVYELPVPGMADGRVTLRVRGVDTNGTRYPDVVRTFVVDNTPPLIDQHSVAGGGSYPVGHVVAFRVTDANLDSVTATLNGLPMTSGQRLMSVGPQELRITARDHAGNETQQILAFVGTAASVTRVPVPVPLNAHEALLILTCLAMAFLARSPLRRTQKK